MPSQDFKGLYRLFMALRISLFIQARECCLVLTRPVGIWLSITSLNIVSQAQVRSSMSSKKKKERQIHHGVVSRPFLRGLGFSLTPLKFLTRFITGGELRDLANLNDMIFFFLAPKSLTAINTCLDEMEEFKGRDRYSN